MASIETKQFKAGDVIFKEGDKADCIYFMLSGKVSITRNQGGKTVTLATLEKDAVFGEMALIDNKPRSANVIALEDSECLKATESNFTGVLSKSNAAIKTALKELSTIIREKNVLSGGDLPPGLQQKISIFKKNSQGNIALEKSLREAEPLISNVYSSLFSYLG
ncbi:MAG: two-component system response regulator [Rickettsiales bacterium]|jgi:CRP-like cAMP-binding protein|nr:two-component system response regulator [Rickettsiales bacterium]